MISVGLWDGIHPLLVNIPLLSEYTVPYGLIYARNPSAQTEEFAESVADICSKCSPISRKISFISHGR